MPRPSATTHVLRTARKKRGLSQERLAELAKTSVTTLKAIEGGRIKPSGQLAHRLSIVTRLSTRQLMENSQPDSPKFSPELYEPFKDLVGPETSQFSNVIQDLFKGCKSSTEFFVLRWMIYEKLRELGVEFGLRVRLPAMREITRSAKTSQHPSTL